MNNSYMEVRDSFFSLIRCGLDIENSAVNVSEEDCETILRYGKRQSLLPIIVCGFRKMGITNEAIKQCDRSYFRSLHKTTQRDAELKKIIAALDGHGVQYVLLKGAEMRNLYPDPSLRTSCDIDILVKEERLQDALRAIEDDTDFKTVEHGYHDIVMSSPLTRLELHFSIKENMEKIDFYLKDAWNNTVKADEDGQRYVFEPEFQVFHLISHMYYHFLNGGLGIRNFLDLWLLREKTRFDETILSEMLSYCGILTFYKECCDLSRVWLEKKEYSETSLLLEEFCFSGGVFGSDKFRNASRQRNNRGVKYLLSRIFPPPYQVYEFYKDDKKKHSLPYYYIKRLMSWIRKDRRADLKTHVNEVMNSSGSYLDKADELFRMLDLSK